MEQTSRIGLLPYPLHKLPEEFPEILDTLVGLTPQPFPYLGLISKAIDPEELPGQGILVEGLGVRETSPACA
jgi:hypothetical protein